MNTTFTVINSNMIAALKVVAKTITNKTLPILSCVGIFPMDGGVIVYGTNLGHGVTRMVGGKVGEGFKGIALPHAALSKVLSKLFNEDERLDFEIDYSTLKAIIRQGTTEFVINGMDIDEFPQWLRMDDCELLGEIEAPDAFAAAGKHVLMASAREDNFPLLMSMNMQNRDGELHLACADGYTLHKAALPVELKVGSLNLPFVEAGHMLSNLTSMQMISMFSDPRTGAILFDQGLTSYWMLPVDGKFPDYESIIPGSQPYSIVLRGLDVVSALEGLRVLAEDSANAVALTSFQQHELAESVCVLTACSQEVGTASKVLHGLSASFGMVPGVLPLGLAFNLIYLLRVAKDLKNICAADMELTFGSAAEPITIKPKVCDNRFVITDVIMPMSLKVSLGFGYPTPVFLPLEMDMDDYAQLIRRAHTDDEIDQMIAAIDKMLKFLSGMDSWGKPNSANMVPAHELTAYGRVSMGEREQYAILRLELANLPRVEVAEPENLNVFGKLLLDEIKGNREALLARIAAEWSINEIEDAARDADDWCRNSSATLDRDLWDGIYALSLGLRAIAHAQRV